MIWILGFLVIAGGGLWLLIKVCERAPVIDENEKRGPELETWELDHAGQGVCEETQHGR